MALRRIALGAARRVLAPRGAGIFGESAHGGPRRPPFVRFCAGGGSSGPNDGNERGDDGEDAAGADAPVAEVESPVWNVPDDAPSPETHARASSSSPVGQDGDRTSDGKDDPARGKKFVPYFVRAGNAAGADGGDTDADAPQRERRGEQRGGSAARRRWDESENLFVRNLPPDFSAAKLAKLFRQHGDVLSAKYVADVERSPYGFVRFKSKDDAAVAVAELHGVKLGGDGVGPATAPLEVSVAMTKAEQRDALADRRRRKEEAREERAARKAAWETRHKEWLARQAEWDARQRLREERRAAARERVSIHVKGAPRGLDAEKVAKIFAPFGDVARVKLWYANGPSPSAVLSMGTAEQAAAAIAMLGGRKLEGCLNPMTITVARSSRGKGAKASSESADESSDSEDSESSDSSESESESEPDVVKLPVIDVDDEMLAKQRAAMDAASAIAAEVRAARSDAFVGRRPTGDGDRSGTGRDDARAGRAYGGRRGPGGSPTASSSVGRHAARGEAVAGPGASDFRLDARATERLESAAGGFSRRRGAGRSQFGGFENASLRPGGRRGPGGGSGGGSSSRRRSARDVPFGAGPIDAKTRAAIAARVREAREAAHGDVTFDWDVGEFEHGARLEFDENWNTAEFNAAPYVPGFGLAKPVEEEDGAMLDAHKDWLMRVGNIANDAQYEESKRIALQQFEHYKRMDEKERISRGASPFHGDFIAERRSLAEQVEGIPADSPMYAFAKKAVDALDGNAGWSYDRKVRALRFLATRAEKYGQGEDASAPVEG